LEVEDLSGATEVGSEIGEEVSETVVEDSAGKDLTLANI
jgi:hypothetical protein